MNIDDICPVSETLDFFQRKWVLCIILDMFNGCKHFTDFQQANPDISNYVLSQSLKYMEEIGLVEKNHIDTKTRNKTEYILTDKGLKVNKILYELTIFSLTELDSSKLNNSTKQALLDKYSNILDMEPKKLWET